MAENILIKQLLNIGEKILFELINDLVKDVTGKIIGKFPELIIPKEHIKKYQEPSLSKERLVAIAKENMVNNASEIYARLDKYADGYCVQLTYGNNREPLPPETNNYIFIVTDGIKRDIDTLFGNNNLIILN